jgi:hypothetical protein
MSDAVKLIKDKECIHCRKFFECNGKPKNKPCVNLEEIKKDGRS